MTRRKRNPTQANSDARIVPAQGAAEPGADVNSVTAQDAPARAAAYAAPSPAPLVDPAYLQQLTLMLRAAGQAANQVGAHQVFTRYRSFKAENTLRRQDADLRAFETFLNEVLARSQSARSQSARSQSARLQSTRTEPGLEIPYNALRQDPTFWRGITWGLVEAFVHSRLQQGYAASTANFQLSTIKVYAGLAAQAGELPKNELPLIQAVKAIRQAEAVRLDEKREVTRVGKKKAEPTELTDALAEALIDQRTDTPQGRRDRLLMCLLLRHGLRVSEIARLKAENIDLEQGFIKFYRPKVTKTQIHEMTEETWAAAKAFFYSGDAPTSGPLFTETNSNGKLDRARRGVQPMTTRGINNRVHILGLAIGIDTLSPHDCRHYWATRAAADGVPLERLKQAGGWNSVHMPVRYINDSAVANEGMGRKKRQNE